MDSNEACDNGADAQSKIAPSRARRSWDVKNNPQNKCRSMRKQEKLSSALWKTTLLRELSEHTSVILAFHIVLSSRFSAQRRAGAGKHSSRGISSIALSLNRSIISLHHYLKVWLDDNYSLVNSPPSLDRSLREVEWMYALSVLTLLLPGALFLDEIEKSSKQSFLLHIDRNTKHSFLIS